MIHQINHYIKNPLNVPRIIDLDIREKIYGNMCEYLDILFSQEVRENINFDIWWNHIRDQ